MHPEERAFIAAIRANPADDTPRLVYADWLDEHDDARGAMVRGNLPFSSEQKAHYIQMIRKHPGDDGLKLGYAQFLEQSPEKRDTDRAEFIRVQMRLAALPPGDSPEKTALQEREWEVGQQHYEAWKEEDLQGWRGTDAPNLPERYHGYPVFSRGFFNLGATISNHIACLVHSDISSENHNMCQWAIKQKLPYCMDINSSDGKDTPLHKSVCTRSNTDEITTTLLTLGADVNAKNSTGSTPLHLAVSRANRTNYELYKILVEAGADINAADHNGRTPLMSLLAKASNPDFNWPRVSREDNQAILQDLLARGAAFDTKTIQFATDNNLPEFADRLQDELTARRSGRAPDGSTRKPGQVERF